MAFRHARFAVTVAGIALVTVVGCVERVERVAPDERADERVAQEGQAVTTALTLVYSDNFEGPLTWGHFEESVAGDSCSRPSGAPDSVVTLTTARARSGTHSLRILANPLNTPQLDNHVIAQRRLATSGQAGLWRYVISVYVDPAALELTQDGPELSVQNTRRLALDPDEWRTMTAGVQYVGNKWAPPHWNIWAPNTLPPAAPNSEQADWITLPGLPTLTETGWYTVTLVVDYDARQYVRARLVTPSGQGSTFDLRAWRIARELKFSEGALWITAEAQNLYTCGVTSTPYQATVDYDDVRVLHSGFVNRSPVAAAVPSVLTDANQPATIASPITDPDGNLDWSTFKIISPPRGTVVANAGSLTYTPPHGFAGGDGFQFRVCDQLLECATSWVDVGVTNHPPVARSVTLTTPHNQSLSLPVPATDPDDNLDPSTTRIMDPPAHGSATVDAAGILTYTPDGTTVGSVGFSYNVCDRYGLCAGNWILVNLT